MIVFFYAALMTLIYIGQSFIVISHRKRVNAALGDGGDAKLQACIRTHGNFSEYVPLGLLLIYFVEMSGAVPAWGIHALALGLLIGRVWHYFALNAPDGPASRMPFRIAGMVLTFLVLGVCAIALLWHGAVI